MPVLDKAFDNFRDEVCTILQEFQKCLQYLQEMCLTVNNFSVAKQTPVYIRSIEAFSLRVKQLLYVNQCDSAFSVDLFKNIAKAETKKKGKNVLKSKENVKSAKKKGKGKSKEEEKPEEEEEPSEIEDEEEEDDDEEEDDE